MMIGVSCAADSGRARVKFKVFHGQPLTSATVRKVLVSQISFLQGQLAHFTTVDRGHRHSIGESCFCLWLSAPSPSPGAPGVGGDGGPGNDDGPPDPSGDHRPRRRPAGDSPPPGDPWSSPGADPWAAGASGQPASKMPRTCADRAVLVGGDLPASPARHGALRTCVGAARPCEHFALDDAEMSILELCFCPPVGLLGVHAGQGGVVPSYSCIDSTPSTSPNSDASDRGSELDTRSSASLRGSASGVADVAVEASSPSSPSSPCLPPLMQRLAPRRAPARPCPRQDVHRAYRPCARDTTASPPSSKASSPPASPGVALRSSPLGLALVPELPLAGPCSARGQPPSVAAYVQRVTQRGAEKVQQRQLQPQQSRKWLVGELVKLTKQCDGIILRLEASLTRGPELLTLGGTF